MMMKKYRRNRQLDEVAARMIVSRFKKLERLGTSSGITPILALVSGLRPASVFVN